MKAKKILWVEAWIDSASVEYVLLLRQLVRGELELLDPAKSYKVIETFEDYEAAVHWLNEDEYDLIEGRFHMDLDDGFE